MHNEATKPGSVSVHVRIRECKYGVVLAVAYVVAIIVYGGKRAKRVLRAA